MIPTLVPMSEAGIGLRWPAVNVPSTHPSTARARVEVLDPPERRHERLVRDVREGLSRTPKVLPPKYFYDARGSRLFDEITGLDEYYPTRAETAILEACADELLGAVRPAELIEIGSGSSKKTRLLLRALRGVDGERYVPLDVSADALEAAVHRLQADFPWLAIRGLVGEFEHGLSALAAPAALPGARGRADAPRRRLVCFLGSTIGNLEPGERLDFLRGVRRMLREGDGFLLGVDLVKDPRVLEAAYDDARGVTAAFNKNLLRVLNRELDGDLDESAFRHVAFYDRERARIEMHLEATRAHGAHLRAIGLEARFAAGERMRTEISCKFERAGVERELARADLELELWRTDPEERFALVLARPA